MSFQWLDAKYTSLLSFRLRNFKQKNQYNWNFSCPVCGDSKRNKHKARGYIYPGKGQLVFHCHNCNDTRKFSDLLKFVDQSLYSEYVKEKLVDSPPPKSEAQELAEKMKPPVFQSSTPLKKLKKISSLLPNHPVKVYVEKRGIPSEYHYKLYLCKAFKKWVNEFIPYKFESEDHDEPRLVIPLLDQEKNLIGVQGRSFKKDSPVKYITILLDENNPKLYGLESVDFTKPVYVVEGPIDSMFLPNCLASCGGDLTTELPIVGSVEDFIVVYDNEPRNKDIVKNIQKAIDKGYKVCIWPDGTNSKDINDMVGSGLSRQKVVDIINSNLYSGLSANLRLQTWKKV